MDDSLIDSLQHILHFALSSFVVPLVFVEGSWQSDNRHSDVRSSSTLYSDSSSYDLEPSCLARRLGEAGSHVHPRMRRVVYILFVCNTRFFNRGKR